MRYQNPILRDMYPDPSVCRSGDTRTEMGFADTRYLSSEVAGGFTGVMIGLYAVDEAGRTADFTDLHLTHTEQL